MTGRTPARRSDKRCPAVWYQSGQLGSSWMSCRAIPRFYFACSAAVGLFNNGFIVYYACVTVQCDPDSEGHGHSGCQPEPECHVTIFHPGPPGRRRARASRRRSESALARKGCLFSQQPPGQLSASCHNLRRGSQVMRVSSDTWNVFQRLHVCIISATGTNR